MLQTLKNPSVKRILNFFDWLIGHQIHWDLISLVGLSLVVGGVAAFSVPAGCILLGAALLWLGILGARLWAVRRRPPSEEE
jgi:hypothetical protein